MDRPGTPLDTIEIVGGHPAVGFVNTVHSWHADPLQDYLHDFDDFIDWNLASGLLWKTAAAAFKAAEIFNGGGQFGKKPKRLIGAFGLVAFLVYKSRLVGVRRFIRFLSRAIGVRTEPVFLPFAEGPIDVDRMSDWKLAEQIIRKREGIG